MQAPRRKTRAQPHAGRAFTLIEMLIAISVVVIIALGLAFIFESLGNTVSGGRRAARFNSIVGRIERQMRADFQQITRDGFLVIRNQYTTNGTGQPIQVSRFTSDPQAPRRRRIDEIMFFTRGDFATARTALDARMIASGDSARIYYGHGISVPDANLAYNAPFYDDQFPGELPGRVGGPNEFASDWALVRQVTVLRPLQFSDSLLPSPLPLGVTNPADLQDDDTTIAFQPAAKTIFRSLIPIPNLMGAFGGGVAHPWTAAPPEFTSGLVDIATTDLSEIRQLVLAANDGIMLPNQITNPSQMMISMGGHNFANGPAARNLMREWMLDAMPANSSGQYGEPRTRIRTEPGPTDFFGVQTIGNPIDRFYARSNQRMLSASRFIPSCTEFIVEWSFGVIDDVPASPTFGELIWHGLDRPLVDDDFDQMPDFAGSGYAARPFPQSTSGMGPYTYRTPYLLRCTGRYTQPGEGWDFNGANLISPQISPVGFANEYESFFGFFDPEFNTSNPNITNGPDGAPDNCNIPGSTIDDPLVPSELGPWPWPKMIRVTITVADSMDPSIEQTFQFVFDLPLEAGG